MLFDSFSAFAPKTPYNVIYRANWNSLITLIPYKQLCNSKQSIRSWKITLTHTYMNQLYLIPKMQMAKPWASSMARFPATHLIHPSISRVISTCVYTSIHPEAMHTHTLNTAEMDTIPCRDPYGPTTCERLKPLHRPAAQARVHVNSTVSWRMIVEFT